MIEINSRYPLKTGSNASSGIDLEVFIAENEAIELKQGIITKVPTGVYIRGLRTDEEGQVRPRSGVSLLNNIQVVLGTIDSDYEGEISALVLNPSLETITIRSGDPIAQLVINKIVPTYLIDIKNYKKESTPKIRGVHGFGHSDNKIYELQQTR